MHTDPPIWRLIQIPANVRLNEFHHVIQFVMGWDDSHLHPFIKKIGRQTALFAPPAVRREMRDYADGNPNIRVHREADFTLAEVLEKSRAKILYEYDFGDGWLHEVQLVKILPCEPSLDRLLILDGQGACPSKDCGGPLGYYALLEAYQDAGHPDHGLALEWLGEDYDPAFFDLEALRNQAS